MARGRRSSTKVNLNEPAVKRILTVLLEEFREKGLGSEALRRSYKGRAPEALKSVCCEGNNLSEVDFDLALQDLENGGLVKTGPMAAYDNLPGASVVIVGLYSKNEYTYLSEEGYKAAVQVRSTGPARAVTPRVSISGSTFHNSTLWVGDGFQQTVSIVAQADVLFNKLRAEIQVQIQNERERIDILTRLDELETASDKTTRFDRYNHFIAAAANYMTIIGPFLPPLIQWLTTS